MALYTDSHGKMGFSGDELRYLLLNADFVTAWSLVMTHVMKYEVKWFHKKLMEHQHKNKFSLCMAGRGLGKSECLDIAYSITNLLRNRNITIAVIASSNDQAVAFVKHIREYFEAGVIPELFGDLRGKQWTDGEFTVRRTLKAKEASVTAGALTASGRLIGKHFDIIIMDDPVSKENCATKKQREKFKDFMNNVVFPLLEQNKKQSSMNVIGTFYHFSDYYNDLINGDMFQTLKIPALIKVAGDVVSVWEERKSKEYLLQLKSQIGVRAFNYQYLMKCPKGEGTIFRRSSTNYFHEYVVEPTGTSVILIEDEEQKVIPVRVFMGCDLAISEKQTADRTVIAVIGVDMDMNYYLLDMFAGRLSFHEQQAVISEYWERFPDTLMIGVESVAFQKAVSQELRRNFPGIPVIEIKTMTDKTSRFNIFAAQFEADRVFINENISCLDLLEDEMFNFGVAEHDDTIDAFTLAFETSNRKRHYVVEKVTPGGNDL